MPRTHPNRRAAALLASIILLSVAPQRSAGQILVNEFLFNDPDTRLEFVEILNHSTSVVDLGEFEISDSRRVPVPLTRRRRLLAPDAYAVFVRDTVAFDARFLSERFEVPRWPALNNGGDTIILWTNGSPVDSVSFDGSWGAYGRSVERVDPDAPSSSPVNWRASVDRSGATPGRENSVFNPDDTPPKILEVEEWTDGSVIVYVNEPLSPATLSSARFSFTSGDRPRGSRLSADGMEVILQPWSGADLSALTVDGLLDASGNRAGVMSMSIARQPAAVDVIVNEILYEPLADAYDGLPDQFEFVEIRSLVNHPIAVRGMYLTGRPTETGVGDTLRAEDRPRRLHGRGYGIFHAAGADPSLFVGAYPSIPPESVAVRAWVDRPTLSLDNGGDIVRLHSARGSILDEVAYDPSWHQPERAVTRGISLERILDNAAGSDGSNWTSSVSPEGATPGRTNSVALNPAIVGEQILSVAPSPFSPDGDGWEDFVNIVVRTGRPSSSLALWIFDEAGRLVRSMTDALPVGPETSLVWDGRDDDGLPLATGVFIIYAELVDTSAGDVRQVKTPVVLAQSP